MLVSRDSDQHRLLVPAADGGPGGGVHHRRGVGGGGAGPDGARARRDPEESEQVAGRPRRV